MWANTVSRTIMIVWRISASTELSVWMLSTAIPASVKRVSGKTRRKTSSANRFNRHKHRDTLQGQTGKRYRWCHIISHLTVWTHCVRLCVRVCVRVCMCVQQMQLHVVNYSSDCWHERNKFITRDRGRETDSRVKMDIWLPCHANKTIPSRIWPFQLHRFNSQMWCSEVK